MHKGRIAGLLALAVAAMANPAAAQPVADFYAGKTIILMVGSDVGGGYDTNARLIARHLGKFIPGHPKAEDLLSKELIVGGSGSGAENETVPRLLNAVLGTKFKVISGYKSNTEVLLAVERGELQGVGSMSWPNIKTAKQDLYREGKIRILLQNALQKQR